MTPALTSRVPGPARREGHAAAGLAGLRRAAARASVPAPEAVAAPVIRRAGPAGRAPLPLAPPGPMLRRLAAGVAVAVVVHLDRGRVHAACRPDIEQGFTAVMLDGPALPREGSIPATSAVAFRARAAGVCRAGGIGAVGHAGGRASEAADPPEAARFRHGTGVNAPEVWAGARRLRPAADRPADAGRPAAVAAAARGRPAVRGGSGAPCGRRTRRAAAAPDPARIDRIAIPRDTEAAAREAARHVPRGLGSSRRAGGGAG
jgi:hypothetical protein